MLRQGLIVCLLSLGLIWNHSVANADESAPNQVKLIFVGDIMIADDEDTGKIIEQGVDPFEPFAGLLKGADITIGNLECVVAESGEKVRKPYNFRAHPRCLPLLKQYFTGLSVANNHSGDFGKAAFVEQCELLEKAEMPYFGGGRNKVDAHKPWIVERDGVRIALLGYCEVYLKSFQAEDDVPGIAWSEHDDEVLADIQTAREKYHADVVIPFMHWGEEGDPTTDRQRTFARKMIDAGADVIVGTHPHVVQDVEYYKKHLIVYSLSNFLFNGFKHPDNLKGWVLRMTVDKQGMVDWDIVTLQLGEHGVPYPDLKVKSPSGGRGNEEILMRSIEE